MSYAKRPPYHLGLTVFNDMHRCMTPRGRDDYLLLLWISLHVLGIRSEAYAFSFSQICFQWNCISPMKNSRHDAQILLGSDLCSRHWDTDGQWIVSQLVTRGQILKFANDLADHEWKNIQRTRPKRCSNYRKWSETFRTLETKYRGIHKPLLRLLVLWYTA